MAIGTTAALTMMAVASAVSVAGSVMSGQAAAKQSKFQSAVLQQQADRERQIAAANEQDFRRKMARELASRRAVLGASGVESAQGSPLMVSEDFAGEAELQAMRIRSGGETSATRLEQQAALARMSGKNAQTQGFMRAGSTLLSGFAQTGSMIPSTSSGRGNWLSQPLPNGEF